MPTFFEFICSSSRILGKSVRPCPYSKDKPYGLSDNEILFIIGDDAKTVYQSLGALRLQLAKNDKVYFLILQGGMGARILQTSFIRTLVRQRKAEKNNYPILVCDNTLIGHMVSAALSNQNELYFLFDLNFPHNRKLLSNCFQLPYLLSQSNHH